MTSLSPIAIIKISDYDLTGLPKQYQNPNSIGFAEALENHIKQDYSANGLFAKAKVDKETIEIAHDTEATTKSEEALDALQRGNYKKGKILLEELLADYPLNAVVLYNLGMVYSDEGNLSRAVELLNQATKVNKSHAHAWTALAVAYARNRNLDKAIESAKSAYDENPGDPYVLRTFGTILAQKGETKEALKMLESAAALVPTDSITLHSLAECLCADNAEENKQRADELYKKVIELAPGSPQAEKAKDRRREFAYYSFRKSGELRPDAIMYCLSALEKFSALSQHEIAGVAMETATLGESGLDVNNPNKHYQLRTIPGNYTGLNVVCILHTAIQKLAPGNDSGFDVQAEYEAALKLFNQKN